MSRRAALVALSAGAVSLALALRAGSQVPPGDAPEAAPPRPYDHVVIVSFDGMRPDGMAQANAPTLRRMVAEGANALVAETVGDSSTLPSHSSMLTGVEVRAHGMTFDDFRPHRGFIRVPTVLYRAHDAGFATAMFVAKAKLRHIALPGSVDVWSLPSWRCDRVASAAAEYLARSPAGITFIHFGEPDGAGHRHRWMSAEYLEAISRSDACLATVMAALEARPDRHRVLVMVSVYGHDFPLIASASLTRMLSIGWKVMFITKMRSGGDPPTGSTTKAPPAVSCSASRLSGSLPMTAR